MIDTIKLVLNKDMFWVTDVGLFQKQTQNASHGYFTLVQNPTQGELKNGIYKPRLTLTNRFNTSGRSERTLTIELSLPKLLFGNNFDELTQTDFFLIIPILQSKLKEMGIRVFTEILENAPISAIHYSKNILLTNGLTSHYIISKIKEANIPLSLDINETDYRNDGHSYKWHSNSYELTFYDKVKDYEIAKKSDKRAIEKDNAIQLGLFDNFEKRTLLEVLRMEVRLNTRRKIKQLLAILGIQSELTFKNLFSPDISQRVLLYYINEIENKRLPLFDYKPDNDQSLLAELIINNPDLRPRKIIQIYGLKLIFDRISPRELRSMFSGYTSKSWYRIIAEARSIKLPLRISPLKVIRDSLVKFEPLKVVDFQDRMINNDKYVK